MAPQHMNKKWSKEDGQRLIKLRDEDGLKWDQIASELNRGPQPVREHYKKLKEEALVPPDFQWTDELDQKVIDGRRQGYLVAQIAADIGLPNGIIIRRTRHLRDKGLIQNVPRGRPKITFTDEEDEMILRLWIAMTSDSDISVLLNLPGKTEKSVRDRRIFHTQGAGVRPMASEMYLKLLAGYGDKKRTWTANDVLAGNFTFGEWKDWGITPLKEDCWKGGL
ncbi:hypothetical protein BU26DRAFT_502928 [Trematosphaeria pertusa]|uniref:Myb-like domain-containing protein n=1 Tax=Trematosphaeria pertusa TaxID=390896 RepID=A0A6A6IQV4_9PLEO|nr:uncharacterized protein BU26DRAFT_502928 [Trematosphaeria pertusa]KAF2252458.1 hypothetical protein BU26DRAFT_502928 [Trematosphaeria pertusa]